MKRLIFIAVFIIIATTSWSQFVFDLGLKGGVNFSEISLNLDDYNESSITRMHMGAFGRIGVNKVFLQPEVYFTKKGSGFESDLPSFVSEFNYDAVDVPLLLGVKLIDAELIDLHLLGGPVFGFMTDSGLKGEDDVFDKSYIKDHYIGIQYGAGIDVLFLTLDLKIEQGSNVYNSPQPKVEGNNSTFMVSLGFRIL